MLAKVTRLDEMVLDNDEAKLLAQGVADVAQHYNVAVDPKTMAWINLMGILFAVYGSRFMLLLNKNKRSQKPVSRETSPQEMPREHMFDMSSLTSIPGAAQ